MNPLIVLSIVIACIIILHFALRRKPAEAKMLRKKAAVSPTVISVADADSDPPLTTPQNHPIAPSTFFTDVSDVFKATDGNSDTEIAKSSASEISKVLKSPNSGLPKTMMYAAMLIVSVGVAGLVYHKLRSQKVIPQKNQ